MPPPAHAQAPRAQTPAPAPITRAAPPPRAAVPLDTAIPTQPVRQPALEPQRAEPPSPVEFSQHRPAASAMPQVTPSVPSQGGMRPEGQPALRASQPALKSTPAPAPARVLLDGPELRTMPTTTPIPRSFTPAPAAAPRKPNALPAELLVTQPGLPGPFAQAREMPHGQSIPQRPVSLPELRQVNAPDPSLQPASGEAPRFEQPDFEEGELGSDTVTAEPASWWRRTGAWLTDLVFVCVLVLGFLMVAMAVIAPKNLTPLQQLMAIAMPGAALAGLLAFFYTTLFAFLWAGRTPGRRLMGIRLVDVTGHSPGVARSLLRAALSLVSFGLCLSGFWLALFDRHGQTLHDKLTRTFVVKLQDA